MNDREALELLDWKRRIFSLYAEIRTASDAESACAEWRRVRDDMFRTHPQSPLPPEERSSFSGLAYFEYDTAYRVLGELGRVEPQRYDIVTSDETRMSFTRVAELHFDLPERSLSLEVYWLDAYGGGLFLPFRDGTAGAETYGAGRYLFDTVKGADLGSEGNRLVLDFNFAYNPSCAYDPRWVCPLAPPPNRLQVAIAAGEKNVSE